LTESRPSSSSQTGPVRPPTAAPLCVSVRTLGCKVNRAESERIAAELLGANIEISSEERAAVIIVNTCAVTGEAEAKARKAVRHAASLGHAPVVVVTGCVSVIAADRMRSLADRVVVESEKSRVAELVLSLLGQSATTSVPIARVGVPFRTRAMVKIEDGCDAFCSYCIVPYARGLPRSVPRAEIIAQVRALVAAGVPEVVLTGINIGRYRDGEADLADVIAAVARTGIGRIRLSSVEPQDLTDRLIETMASTTSFLPHLHVPLQSGSDSVLRPMKRTYTVQEFEERIEAARIRIPGLAVTTDVIAGFPTESDEAARDTLTACERMRFSKLHVFRYSTRSGTAAADMEQVPAALIAARAQEIRVLGDRLRARYIDSRLGQTTSVLIEQTCQDHAEGTTGDYLKVLVPTPGLCPGDLTDVVLAAREDSIVVSEPL